jgi:hypothetical protein
MLRKPGSLYENKRSSTLLKVKTFYDEGKFTLNKIKSFLQKSFLFSRSSSCWS